MMMLFASTRHSGEGRNPDGPRDTIQRRLDPGLRRGDESGFTLVELMVVIVIIGLLATVVLINVVPALSKSAVTKAKADISTLEQGLEMYRLNNMHYPAGDQGLNALVSEGYIKRLPNDPWGNPYHYAMPGADGRAFDVFSYGADGRQGGEGENADIGNWDIK